MRSLVRLTSLLTTKAASLTAGALFGALLAVAIVAGRPHVWLLLLTTINRAELAPGEADDTWILWIEWRYAVTMGVFCAFVGCLIWLAATRLRLTSAKLAAGLGAVLSVSAALLTFATDEGHRPSGAPFFYLLFVIAGALAGLVTFYLDRLFSGWRSRLMRSA